MTQSEAQETETDIELPSYKEPKSFLCKLGFHKWDMFSMTYDDGKCHTFNQCKRECPHYNDWKCVDVSYPWD